MDEMRDEKTNPEDGVPGLVVLAVDYAQVVGYIFGIGHIFKR